MEPEDFKLNQSQLKFYVGYKSFASFIDADIEVYKKMVACFADEPIYYISFLLADLSTEKKLTPLDMAIQKNSPKLVEVMLNALNQTPSTFQISKAVNRHFPNIFKLKIKSFD